MRVNELGTVCPKHRTLAEIADADLHAVSSHKRFLVMDGLRGVAALAVVLFHTFYCDIISNTKLAVDLFYILSGFVISFSYDTKLAGGMSFREFAVRRFIRLYPMLWLGAIGGVVIAVVHNYINSTHAYRPISIVIEGGLSVLVIPYLDVTISNLLFPFNPPMWSLFFEIWANIAYAIFWRWLTVPLLIALTIGGLISIGFLGPLGGNFKSDFACGFPRVISGFFGGVLLYKLWRTNRLPRIRANIIALSFLIFVLFTFPFKSDGWSYAPFFFVLWLTVLAAANAPLSRWDKISTFLGEMSYPTYLTHWLSLYVFMFVGSKIGLGLLNYSITGVVHLLLAPFIGFALFHFYEKPAMLLLRRVLTSSQ